MKRKIMKEYLNKFETEVMLKILDTGLNAFQPSRQVPMKPGKLGNTDFGVFVGDVFKFDGILAFNYYGMYKLSEGTKTRYIENIDTFPGIKVIRSPVINFASILPSDVRRISPKLFPEFVAFKNYMVNLRWKR